MTLGAGAFARYEGPAYRQSLPRYAEVTARTLAANARTGSRFNAAGEFGVLYVSLDPDTPFRELRRQAERDGSSVLDLLPRTLFALDVKLERVLDLTREEVRARVGISREDLYASDWRACQVVGRDAREAGYEAIRYRRPTEAAKTSPSSSTGWRQARSSASGTNRRFVPASPDPLVDRDLDHAEPRRRKERRGEPSQFSASFLSPPRLRVRSAVAESRE